MDLTHRFTVPASIEEAWDAFNRLESIASCFPGATVSSIEGDDFAGSVKVKLGPIALVYNGTGRFVARDVAARRAVIEAKGKDKRGNGTANAKVTASFVQSGDGTEVEVVTDLAITGKPAQFGRGVIQDVSDKLLDQFVTCVSDKFAHGFDPAPVAVVDGADTEATVEMPVTDTAANGSPARAEATAAGLPKNSDTTAPGPPGGQSGAPYSYTPPQDSSTSDLNMLTTIAPVLLKRLGPALAGLVAVTWIVLKLIKRKK